MTDCFFGAIVLFYFTAICFLGRLCRSQRAGDYAGDDVVFVGFGDFGFVEAAGFQRLQRAEVVEVDFAVDLRGVELGAGFPEERGFFAFAFGEDDQLAAYPLLFGALADGLLELHQAALAGLDGAVGDSLVEREGGGAFFVRVIEDA